MAVWVLLNNFMHDFSAAGWIFGSVVVYALLKPGAYTAPAPPALLHALRTVMVLMRWSLAGIVVFGIVRALAYKSYEWSAAAGDAQVTLLIVKHILLTAVFLAGLTGYLKARRIVGRGTPCKR